MESKQEDEFKVQSQGVPQTLGSLASTNSSSRTVEDTASSSDVGENNEDDDDDDDEEEEEQEEVATKRNNSVSELERSILHKTLVEKILSQDQIFKAKASPSTGLSNSPSTGSFSSREFDIALSGLSPLSVSNSSLYNLKKTSSKLRKRFRTHIYIWTRKLNIDSRRH
jgi:hypothetical protein